MNLTIATPAYHGLSAGYFRSAIATSEVLRRRGVGHSFLVMQGQSLINKVRDEIAAAFLKSQSTHLLMVDSDITWDPGAVIAMLDRDVDFVAAACPKRCLTAEGGPAFAVGFKDGGRNGFEMVRGTIEAEGVGTAFLMIRRRVIERLKDAHPELAYRDPQSGAEAIGVFTPIVERGTLYGEDISFCRRWRALGEKIWLLVDAPFEHEASFKYRGNFGALVGASGR